jgi:hypothetical protein
MSRSKTEKCAALAAALAGALLLSGCGYSELAVERRDTVSRYSGDAVATNRVVHMIDPWSPASGQRDIAFNGERAVAAIERYRTNRVTPPVNITTSSANYQQVQQSAASAATSTAQAGQTNGKQ